MVLFADRRTLTQEETHLLTPIFSDQVNYDAITLYQVILPKQIAAIVIGNHIFYEKEYYRDDFSQDVMKMSLLSHEVAHVWLNQTYAWWKSVEAIFEHLQKGQDVYAISEIDHVSRIQNLQIEQQARVVAQAYLDRHYGFENKKLQALIKTIAE